MVVFFVIYFCGILAFTSSRKHLLITLLRLEFVVFVLYFSFSFYSCNFNYSLVFVLLFFYFFSVCQVSLVLSVLFSMIRSHGNYFSGFLVCNLLFVGLYFLILFVFLSLFFLLTRFGIYIYIYTFSSSFSKTCLRQVYRLWAIVSLKCPF